MTTLILFLFGTILGSFANVIIFRLRQEEAGILWGRSYCPQCKHQLSFWDLVPIFSYIFIKGKCRYCKTPISPRYLIGEIMTGGFFALTGFLYPLNFNFDLRLQVIALATYLLIIFVLVIVTLYDAYYLEIPDVVMFPAILLALIASFFDPLGILSLGAVNSFVTSTALYALIGALIPFSFFALQIIISKGKWMGGGDLRLGAFMGAILGIKLVLVALFVSYISGAIIGLITIAVNRKSLKSTLPFGPFLSFGTIIALFWGYDLISWYWGLVLGEVVL